MKVLNGKGLASRTVPESCVRNSREARHEALTEVRVGQPSSREIELIRGRLGLQSAIAFCHSRLHHSSWNVAPHQVRRLAHSLKRDVEPVAANRQIDSPVSMTSPRTTLTRGQYRCTIAQSVFRGATSNIATAQAPRVSSARFAAQADYFANPAFERTRGSGRGSAMISGARAPLNANVRPHAP